MENLDKFDLQLLKKEINKVVPINTDKTMQFQIPFHKGMPKDMLIAYNESKERFFDNYDCYRDKLLVQPIEYHSSTVINPFISFIVSIPDGEDLETNSGDSGHSNSWGNTLITCDKLPATPVNPSLFDQVSVKGFAMSTNVKIGVYDDSAGTPNNLLATSGSVSGFTDYAFKSVTEFESTSQMWMAFIGDGTSDLYVKVPVDDSLVHRFAPTTFSAQFSDPSIADTPNTNQIQAKVGHS